MKRHFHIPQRISSPIRNQKTGQKPDILKDYIPLLKKMQAKN